MIEHLDRKSWILRIVQGRDGSNMRFDLGSREISAHIRERKGIMEYYGIVPRTLQNENSS